MVWRFSEYPEGRPGADGTGIPSPPGAERSFVDTATLAIRLLIVLLVVIDRVMRRQHGHAAPTPGSSRP